mmetsp:Transcript_31275/g.103144  ORF Transcript_31275/g.103144 Transcript_31275/m.103144 type:complete len:319 (-) Transcript_31275:161-1117(-)
MRLRELAQEVRDTGGDLLVWVAQLVDERREQRVLQLRPRRQHLVQPAHHPLLQMRQVGRRARTHHRHRLAVQRLESVLVVRAQQRPVRRGRAEPLLLEGDERSVGRQQLAQKHGEQRLDRLQLDLGTRALSERHELPHGRESVERRLLDLDLEGGEAVADGARGDELRDEARVAAVLLRLRRRKRLLLRLVQLFCPRPQLCGSRCPERSSAGGGGHQALLPPGGADGQRHRRRAPKRLLREVGGRSERARRLALCRAPRLCHGPRVGTALAAALAASLASLSASLSASLALADALACTTLAAAATLPVVGLIERVALR